MSMAPRPPGRAGTLRMRPAQIRVAVPPRSLRNDLRAVSIVWHREMIRFRRDQPRIITSLLQPLLYLFVLGTGLSARRCRAPAASTCASSCSRA